MTDNTNAERQARWRAKRDAELERLREAAGQTAKPGPQAAGQPAKPAPAPASNDEIDRLRAEIERLRKAAAGQPQAQPAPEPASAAPKAAKPSAAPSDELAKANAEIVRLRKVNDTLHRMIRQKTPKMDSKTYKRILSSLHSDSRNSVSDEKLNEAFNTFKKFIEPLVMTKEEEEKEAKSEAIGREMRKNMREVLEKRWAAEQQRKAAAAARKAAKAAKAAAKG
jgi:hypothetical protein